MARACPASHPRGLKTPLDFSNNTFPDKMKIKYHGRNQSLLKLVPAKKHIIRTQEQSRSRSDVTLSVRWVDDSCLISMAVVLCRHEYTASERQATWWSTNDLNKRKQRIKCTIKEKLQHNCNDDNDSEEEVASIVSTWGAIARAGYLCSIHQLLEYMQQ
jgi:hypothetical protein